MWAADRNRPPVAINRQKAKGRRGGEAERFAMLPESVMRSEAVATMSHPAFRVLAILLVGRSPPQNGRLCCSQTYARQFGLNSGDTLARALKELQQRGLIEVTRKVQRLKRFPTLYRVTWWANHNRDGNPLVPPEPPTHAYRDWQLTSPPHGLNGDEGESFRSVRPTDDYSPPHGLMSASHQSDLTPEPALLQSVPRTQSLDIGARPARRRTPSSSSSPSSSTSLHSKVGKLVRALPHLPDGDIARMLGTDSMEVAKIRESLGAEDQP